eukprot:6101832-Heterocapsa_arctica.AAC.1
MPAIPGPKIHQGRGSSGGSGTSHQRNGGRMWNGNRFAAILSRALVEEYRATGRRKEDQG